MPEQNRIGCVIMASGLSERYGKNKLLEKLGNREIILHTAGSLTAAGLRPLVVTRSEEVRKLAEKEGIRCILHDGSRKSDTIHAGLAHLGQDPAGYLFVPGDQPLIRPSSIRRLVEHFGSCGTRAVRLGFRQTPGSPVLFPAAFREDLLAYDGDRGGVEVLKQKNASCDLVQAEFEWELWDVDTPEKMEQVRNVYQSLGDL